MSRTKISYTDRNPEIPKKGIKMGFDLEGLKPSGEEPLKYPSNAHDNYESKVQRYYYWQEETPGAYYHLGSYSWHFIWQPVCDLCSNDIPLEKLNAGWSNGCTEEFTKEEALIIARKLMDSPPKEYAANTLIYYYKFIHFLESCGGFTMS